MRLHRNRHLVRRALFSLFFHMFGPVNEGCIHENFLSHTQFHTLTLSRILCIFPAFVGSPSTHSVSSVGNQRSTSSETVSSCARSALCSCPSCAGRHTTRCACPGCSMSRTTLYATVEEPEVAVAAPESIVAPEPVAAEEVAAPVEEEAAASVDVAAAVPAEVEAMDGVNDETEAHNADRPARKAIKKKPKGLPLSDFKVGDTITAKVKSVTAYGAFMDIGAETDALLHISNLSVDFVSNVKDVIEAGKEYEVRILTIDEGKKQVALTLLTVEQEEEAEANASASRPAKRESRPQSNNNNSSGGGNARRDDSAVLKQLKQKGWDDSLFVPGTVISTVDFGAFVRIDCSQLNAELPSEEFDGLVHISQLAVGRVNSVESVCKVGDSVKVRVKSIDDRKVGLSMISVEDEAAQAEARGSSGGGSDQAFQGNKDWKEALDNLQKDMPMFSNKPIVTDNRKI